MLCPRGPVRHRLARLLIIMKKLLLFALLAIPVWSQTAVNVQPDCWLPVSFPAGAGASQIDNTTKGCTFWIFSYASQGYSVLSIVVQTAPLTSTGPGSWSTFTAATGSNPNTSTTMAISTFGGSTSYFPWLRVQLTSATGSGLIQGALYGWRIPSSSGGGGGTGCPNPCPVEGLGTAGAQTGGVLTIQGDPAATPVPVTGTITGTFTPVTSTVALSGQQAVTAAAVALAGHALTNGVCVKALAANTINVYVGPSGVTISTGLELAPGDAFCYQYSNTNDIFVIASTTGASVSWGAGH
jgi:hypothetical protein